MKIATLYRFRVRMNCVGTDKSELITCATESPETRDHFTCMAPEPLNVDLYTSQPLYIAGKPHEAVHGGIAFETMEDFLAAHKMKRV